MDAVEAVPKLLTEESSLKCGRLEDDDVVEKVDRLLQKEGSVFSPKVANIGYLPQSAFLISS
jgi:hypothetical protein